MSKVVEFRFDIDQEVETPFGEHGIITMLGYDDGGPMYYVIAPSAEHSRWFKEKMLTAKEGE